MTGDELQADEPVQAAADPWWRAVDHEARETTASAKLDVDGNLVVPIVEETVALEKRTVETGAARIVKHVHERQETVDTTLMQEEVTIQRIAINRPVETPPAVRVEGDTTIYSVLEEVVFVEKRLMLKEEIHVTRSRRETSQPQTVTLRSESVEIERDAPGALQQSVQPNQDAASNQRSETVL